MYPEHVLLEDPWHEAVGYGFVVDAHCSLSLFLSLSLSLLLFLLLLLLVVVVVVVVVFRSPGREARRGRKKMEKKHEIQIHPANRPYLLRRRRSSSHRKPEKKTTNGISDIPSPGNNKSSTERKSLRLF